MKLQQTSNPDQATNQLTPQEIMTLKKHAKMVREATIAAMEREARQQQEREMLPPNAS